MCVTRGWAQLWWLFGGICATDLTWRRGLYSLGNNLLTFRSSQDLQSKDVQKFAVWQREKHAWKLVLSQFQFKKQVLYWFWIRSCCLKQCFVLTTDMNLCVRMSIFTNPVWGSTAHTVYGRCGYHSSMGGHLGVKFFAGIAAQNLLLP